MLHYRCCFGHSCLAFFDVAAESAARDALHGCRELLGNLIPFLHQAEGITEHIRPASPVLSRCQSTHLEVAVIKDKGGESALLPKVCSSLRSLGNVSLGILLPHLKVADVLVDISQFLLVVGDLLLGRLNIPAGGISSSYGISVRAIATNDCIRSIICFSILQASTCSSDSLSMSVSSSKRISSTWPKFP